MVQIAKNQINRHRKTLTIVGVLVFLAVGIFVFNLSQEPAYSASSGNVYPNGDHTIQFPNSTGANHWGVLDEATYDSNDYVNTGTDLNNSPSNPIEEFQMTSIAGASNGVSSVTVYFQAYIQGGCQSDCDTITANIYIDGVYQTSQNFALTGTDTQYSATFNGSWTGDDDLRVQLTKNSEGTGNPAGRDDDVRIGRVFANVTYHLAPGITTNSPSGITSSSATLNGTVDPNNETTTTWFVWDTTGVACSSMANTTGTQSFSGDGDTSFSDSISGLEPGHTYYYCAVASSLGSGGSPVYNNTVSFTAAPAPPSVTTNPESGVGTDSANLNGTVDPNGAQTNAWFVWGMDGSGGCGGLASQNTTTSQDLGSGASPATYGQALNGLLPSQDYYYCAVAENAEGGPVYGAMEQFTTVAIPPTVTTTNPPSVIDGRTATLNGEANPHGNNTTGWFRYSTTNPGTCNDTFGTRTAPAGDDALGSGRLPVPYDQPISGLQPATTHYYCAIAENSAGKAYGDIVSFTTLTDSPDVSTLPAQNVTSREAEFWARVRPNGETTTVWFKLFQQPLSSPPNCSDPSVYIEPRVPKNSADDVNAGSGTSFVDVMYQVNDFDFILIPETEYWYCAVAENNQGTTTASNPEYFETPVGNPPTVETITPPVGVQDTSATLRARVNPNNGTTDVWFRYQAAASPPASCDSLTQATPTQVGIAGDDTWHEFSETLTGLSINTTYYYCAYGSNWDGTRHSTPMDSFSTTVNPVDTNVSGWAWSATTGWISFSSINCDSNNDGISDNAYYSACPTGGAIASYGVDIDYITLNFSGWAWSNGVGWISFDRGVTGPPPASYDPVTAGDCTNCLAWADRDTKEINGWARAISACNNNLWDGSSCTGVGAGNNSGGWDGWIRLDDVNIAYTGALINTAPLPDEFEGWAWGGNMSSVAARNSSVIGWMSLNCLNQGTCGSARYAVYLEDYGGAPSVENLNVEFFKNQIIGDTGSGDAWMCDSYDRFVWDFSDTYPFESQTAYQIQVATDSGFTSIACDTGKNLSSTSNYSIYIGGDPFAQCDAGGTGLAYNTQYYWRMRVWDTTDQPSEYAEGPVFRTSLHAYPEPNFTWAPLEPSAEDETVIFSDVSTATGATTRLWEIPRPDDGSATYVNGTNDTHPSPNVIFSDTGNKTSRLTITDTDLQNDTNFPGSGDGVCYKQGNIYIQLPLPDYDEVNPVGFFEKIKQFFAKINITDYLAKVVKKYV